MDFWQFAFFLRIAINRSSDYQHNSFTEVQSMEQEVAVTYLITLATVLASATMAITGVIQAIRYEFDPFGAGVLGFITAVGGGTIRDVLLGDTPVFWINDLIYIATVAAVIAVSLPFASKMKAGNFRRLDFLNYIDAFGLALFTIVGVQKALGFGTPWVTAVILGAVTGIGGGMIRDLLCGEPPVVLKTGLYATWSILGGGLFVALIPYTSLEMTCIICFLFISLGRIWSIKKSITLRQLGE